jgi:ribosomal protein S18 acetylase RimI-like enzyme
MQARLVRPDEWAGWRALRLRALATDPRAFGASLAEEETQPEAWWQERAGANLVIEEGELWLGTCAVVGEGNKAELYGMWVAPEARGRGVGRALLEAAIERARKTGASHLDLWVNVEQANAVRLYERAGFAASGAPMRGTRDRTRVFLPMRRAL